MANKLASCCSTLILSFHGIDNQHIPNFPSTYFEFDRLHGIDDPDFTNVLLMITGEIDEILGRLGISINGILLKSQKRLKTYLGLRK